MGWVPEVLPGKVRQLWNLVKAEPDSKAGPLAFRGIEADPQTIADFLRERSAEESLSEYLGGLGLGRVDASHHPPPAADPQEEVVDLEI
jgi:hypothetical protein